MIIMDKNLEKSITEITKYIRWYTSKSATATIDDIMICQDKLAGYCHHISTELNQNHSNYIKAYSTRKWSFANHKSRFINNQSMSAAHADVEAEIKIKEDRENEDLYDSLGYKLDLIIKDINRILKVSQQRVSYMKQEFSRQNYPESKESNHGR